MIATPRMQTSISRVSAAGHPIYATVVIEHEGKEALTTMRHDVQASDLEVENFKRRFAHLPQIKEENHG